MRPNAPPKIMPRRIGILGMALLGAGGVVSAHAQDTPADTSATAPSGSLVRKSARTDAGAAAPQENVVVTGTPNHTRQAKAPYAVTTMTAAQIQKRGAYSLADLMRTVPGFSAEASAGAGGGESIYVRGLPGGSYQYLNVLQDGLPIFETSYESYANIDEFYRLDLDTTRVEAVRGGTSPLFANNAPGGTINLITNHGTPDAHQEVKFTTGSFGTARLDGLVSGPINDRLQYTASGYVHRDDGFRDPGYGSAGRGGQFTVGGNDRLDHGKIWADFRYLNDHEPLYTDIPLTAPNGQSLSGLMNPSYGTLLSNDFQHSSFLTPNGVQNHDLGSGLHPDIKTLSGGVEYDLPYGIHLSDKARYLDGSIDQEAIFNGSSILSSQSFLNTALGQARGAFGPGVASVRYAYANRGGLAYDPLQDDGLLMQNTWQSVSSRFTDAMNDLRLDRTIPGPGIGHQDLAAGLYYSHYTFSQDRSIATLLTNVQSNPQAIDMIAYNAAGQRVGALTRDGFTNFGAGDLGGDVAGNAVAFYGQDNWRITHDWQIDAGLRRELEWEAGEAGIPGTVNLNIPGDATSRAVTGLTAFQHRSELLQGTAWSVGTSWSPIKPLMGFARYTKSYSMPRFQNIYNFAIKRPNPTTSIDQAEGGLKLSLPHLYLDAIAFWSRFNNLSQNIILANPNGVGVQTIGILGTTQTVGVEMSGHWRPTGWFGLDGSVTLQDPETNSLSNTTTGQSVTAAEGKQLQRVPRFIMSLQPTLYFDVGPFPAQLFGTVYHVGTRFQDYTETALLPAYTAVDAGLLISPRSWLDLSVRGQNLANSRGLTEGNARADALAAGTQAQPSIGRPIFGRAVFTALDAHF